MAAALTALGVATPTIEPVGAMQEARSQKIMQNGAEFEQERQAFEQIAINGLGVMGGKLDGQVDPVAFDQMLGMMGKNPLAAKLKGRPELLPAIVNGSVNVLKSVNDRETYELAKQKFGLELQQALNKTPDAPDIETIYDPETGRETKIQWNGKDWVPIGGVEAEGRNGQTINIGADGNEYGDPGAGLVWKRGPDGKIVIDERGAPIAISYQGGKAYADEQAALNKTDKAAESKTTAANIVVEDVDRAMTKIKDDPFWTTGLMGAWTANIGGTPAADVQALIDTVEANSAFDKLQAMRESSPTGGALGAVTERELTLLAAAIGSLKQKQTSEQLLENLARVKEVYLDIIHGPGKRPEAGSANVPEGSEETKELDGKTYYRVGADWFEAD